MKELRYMNKDELIEYATRLNESHLMLLNTLKEIQHEASAASQKGCNMVNSWLIIKTTEAITKAQS